MLFEVFKPNIILTGAIRLNVCRVRLSLTQAAFSLQPERLYDDALPRRYGKTHSAKPR